MKSILDFFFSLFGTKNPQPAQPGQNRPAHTNASEPAVIVTRRVLMVVYDPIVQNGQKLSQANHWPRVDDLSAGFLSDILETSGGLARYQIVERVELDEFPLKADGFRYTAESYARVVSGAEAPHQPDLFHYDDFLKRFNIIQRVSANEIDEVWIFAFPFAGLYESTMGGLGAFWCNSQPLARTFACPRRFIIMGFSYERGVGEMLESFGHRAESIMEKVYARVPETQNLWRRFIRYDKTHPGQAECGNVHFAPNSEVDYDWGNPRFVSSRCDDWFNFPNLTGAARQVNAADWGNGDIRAHHKWWLTRFPKVAGRTNGIANNWWQYIMDPNRVSV